ncbi:MAG: endonuclease/exonuclease/phosphatase family protein [Pseudomonadota bacterium]
MARFSWLWIALIALSLPVMAADPVPPRPDGAVRVASFNVALARKGPGLLLRDLERGDRQADAIAEIILRVRPDILLINELDADPEGRALAAFRALLAEGVAGLDGIAYQAWAGSQNVGEPSDRDLDGDGRSAGPGDAWGFGRFPGQYAMAVLSRLPFDPGAIRSWREMRWAAMPGARRPRTPDGTPFHDEEIWTALRLSSKAHWAVPISLPGGGALTLLATHPTPPVFDGPEDRNGRRNADEIRLLIDILDGADWLVDDAGHTGGLAPEAAVVVAGDLNADPLDGDGVRAQIAALLGHPRLQDPKPASLGASAAGGGGPKAGDPALHTADWPDAPKGPGNLRVDYVLPSKSLEVVGSGVFWPEPGHPLARLTKGGRRPASSDHRLVWIDIALPR